MTTLHLTAAQALIRYLMAQKVEINGKIEPLFAGAFAIFGHGNVAGVGEALSEVKTNFPTYRAHNEQAMAHTAIAFAKAKKRRQMMLCTTSIGPGATNLVTAAATAHINRLPVLFVPGDVFANRQPDPVLQQLEQFGDPTLSTNDCLKPVSRYWDRMTRPEQLLASLPEAIHVLTCSAQCGPVTLAFPQDVQVETYAYPEAFFQSKLHTLHRPRSDEATVKQVIDLIRHAKRPLVIAGGGVRYSEAESTLVEFARKTQIPVAETQAGKGVLHWEHPQAVGGIGVTGSAAANHLAEQADLILAVGTRLQDFTTGSRTLFKNPEHQIIQLNVNRFDAHKQGALPWMGDAKWGLTVLSDALSDWCVPCDWVMQTECLLTAWKEQALAITQVPAHLTALPSDAQVIGAVNQFLTDKGTVVCAAGGLPGELHKHWLATSPEQYHAEYGYSCMGYEIAGGLGVKMAHPDREVVVLLGDGSYLMLNSEIATSVMLDKKLTVVLNDNRGFGCIHRLQNACGGKPFNNLFEDATHETLPEIDFVKHAESLGAKAKLVDTIPALSEALLWSRQQTKTTVIVIKTDPHRSTQIGGCWWNVPNKHSILKK